MTRISLEKFVEKTKGKKISTPWGSQKGQCVSLIQAYIKQCLGQPARPRGHATSWIDSYVKEGLGKIVSSPKKGDILVFPKEANGYGHIAIYVKENTIYEQNNGRHDNKFSGYGEIFSDKYVILRPNVELIEDVAVSNNSYSKGNYKTLTEMYVREGAGTNYGIKKVSQLTVDGKRNAVNDNPGANAIYKKGTVFTALEIINKGNEVWAKSPSGYICIKGKKIYCEKI